MTLHQATFAELVAARARQTQTPKMDPYSKMLIDLFAWARRDMRQHVEKETSALREEIAALRRELEQRQ
jgi:hypothetical protein